MTEVSERTSGIRVGTTLDRYEIVRHIATGGMGSIWLGRFGGKHGFKKQVAVKTIAPEFAENPQFHAMFLEEARITSKLEHANVAQVLDVGEYERGVYIVFEWVNGQSLTQICNVSEAGGSRVPVPFLLRIAADVCAGLHAAHELTDDTGRSLGVVHRDVTPANVLVSEAGFAKLIDFGIAKARDRINIQTRAGFVKGTPQYMSPEQASNDVVDRRADLWSLGAVLFRGLSGAPPFRNHDALLAYIEGTSKLPGLPADVPVDVRSIVTRALQVDPARRFATAEEMRAALERALHIGGTSSAEVARITSRLVEQARSSDAAVEGHAPTELAAPAQVTAREAPPPRVAPPAPATPPAAVVVVPEPAKTLVSARPEDAAKGPSRLALLVAGAAVLVGFAAAFAYCGAH